MLARLFMRRFGVAWRGVARRGVAWRMTGLVDNENVHGGERLERQQVAHYGRAGAEALHADA